MNFSGYGGVYFNSLLNTSNKNITIETVVKLTSLNQPSRHYFVCQYSGFSLYRSMSDVNQAHIAAGITATSTSTGSFSGLYGYKAREDDGILYLYSRFYASKGFDIGIPTRNYKNQNVDGAYLKNCTASPVMLGLYSSNPSGASGGAVSDQGDAFSMYSCRIHTRILSDEEIFKNMLYERNRYNF